MGGRRCSEVGLERNWAVVPMSCGTWIVLSAPLVWSQCQNLASRMGLACLVKVLVKELTL